MHEDVRADLDPPPASFSWALWPPPPWPLGRKNGYKFEADSDTVLSAVFSPDGNFLASAGDDGKVKLWDPTTGKLGATLKGHKGAVFSAVFSPDGKTLASCGKDRIIKVWDVKTGKETTTLTGHTDTIFCLAFSPDGKLLASSSYDQTIRIWDLATSKNATMLKVVGGSVSRVAFSPDGKVLASAGGKTDSRTNKTTGELRLWDVSTGKNVAVFEGHALSSSASPSAPTARRSPQGVKIEP